MTSQLSLDHFELGCLKKLPEDTSTCSCKLGFKPAVSNSHESCWATALPNIIIIKAVNKLYLENALYE